MTNIIKLLFKKIGFEVKRYSIAQNQTARMMKILADYKINLVFDVGANFGQFGNELRNLGFKGKIISFEPLLDAYNSLCISSQNDNLWNPAMRTAIGEFDGEIEINIAGNSASSSILEMMDSHITAAPTTANVGVEKVPIRKLDTLSSEYMDDNSRLFIKIT